MNVATRTLREMVILCSGILKGRRLDISNLLSFVQSVMFFVSI